MKPILIALALLSMTGCAILKPGSDPLVVRTEQTLTIAKATLDTFEKTDNANRAFWKTNAPALHTFAEYLRVKVVVNETNYLPRGLAYVSALESVKLAYKQGKASSNAVVTAIAVLDTAVKQAQSFISEQQPITQ